MSSLQRAKRIESNIRHQVEEGLSKWFELQSDRELRNSLGVLMASLAVYGIVTIPEDLPQEEEARYNVLVNIYQQVIKPDHEYKGYVQQLLVDTWLCDMERRKTAITDEDTDKEDED